MEGLEVTVLLGLAILVGPVLAPRLRIATPLVLVVIGLLLDEFGAPWVKISIAKMGIMKGVRRVGVQIERSR